MRFGKMLCLLEAPGRFIPPCFGRIHLHMLHMEEFMKLHKGSEYFFFCCCCSFICLKSSVLLHWYGLLCDTMSNCSHTIEMRPLCHFLVYCYGLWKKHYRGAPVKPSVSQRESRGSDSCAPAFRRKIKVFINQK